MIISELLILIWECLSALSVVTFTADLLLKDDYELIDLQKQEANMKEIKFQNSGVKHEMKLLDHINYYYKL